MFTFLYVPLMRAGIPPLLVLMPAGLRIEVGDAETATLTFLVAIVLGFTTKALLHIRLFNVTLAGSEIPVGTEIVVQPIERLLLRTIAIDEFNAVAAFLKKRAERYNDLADVKNKIKENLPGPATLPENERKALEVELDQAKVVRASMEIYLRAFGVRALDRVFPEKGRR